jgi:peroxiredoxin
LSQHGQVVAFSLPNDEGSLVTLPIPGASATVLDFFGPTCEPCKKKLPELQSKMGDIARKHARLVLVAVLASDESTSDARNALKSWGVNAPFLVDRDGTGQREAGVTALPATLILDSEGRVMWVAPPTATARAVLEAIP